MKLLRRFPSFKHNGGKIKIKSRESNVNYLVFYYFKFIVLESICASGDPFSKNFLLYFKRKILSQQVPVNHLASHQKTSKQMNTIQII